MSNYLKIEEMVKGFNPQKVEKYKIYWDDITPKNHQEYYKRWIFSFLSVHTTWIKNVESYIRLRDLTWTEDKTQLSDLIVSSGVGLHNIRVNGIWKFHDDFWKDPESWYKKETESWTECRDRLEDRCFGLGITKTAFALEMCYPNICEVACLDVHMLRMYGHKPGKKSVYRELEQHWVQTCKDAKMPPFMARNLYWDQVQRKEDTRYWSYVFEENKECVLELPRLNPSTPLIIQLQACPSIITAS